MEVVLDGLVRQECLVFNDVLVVGKSVDEYEAKFVKVLNRLRLAGCKFAIAYLCQPMGFIHTLRRYRLYKIFLYQPM